MKKLSQTSWVVIAFFSLLLFGAFFYLVTSINKRIFLSTPVYFFLIVFIDLGATALLSGAMRSVARYEVKTANKSLYLAGPALIFIIILYIGYKYRPQSDVSPLTLSVLLVNSSDNTNELFKDGTVSVRVGLFHDSKSINNDGAALFTGIMPQYKGSAIDLTVNVPGYRPSKSNKYILSDSADYTNLKISLIKNLDTISIRGRLVALPSRTGIADASINFEGLNKVFKTDSVGNFSASLPFKSGSEVRVIVLRGNKEIYNSLRTLSNNDFLSISPN